MPKYAQPVLPPFDDSLRGFGDAGHLPVLPREVLAWLAPKPGQTVLDCTLGRGGHARLLIPHIAGVAGARYIGLDVDPENLKYAGEQLAGSAAKFDLVQGNFAQARAILDRLGVGKVDLLLADLGFSSNQMDNAERGFSFSREGPLDMRLDPTLSESAADLVNGLPERELADVIYQYGEERLSRKIARKIVEERQRSPILTTAALARVVREAHRPPRRGAGRSVIDPSTRTFMALRIAVNQELAVLERLLDQLPMLVSGRAAIISFHSLEDRLVKRAFLELGHRGLGNRVTNKPVIAEEEETRRNPRSRSAKMRVFEFVRLDTADSLP